RRAPRPGAGPPHTPGGGGALGRERVVAEALARRAPALGPERTARIVQVIVTESLGAAGPP
ncbi:MAG: hypothetical protein LH468_02930, partial [Nocardioides sp.]|nr:hypothetical protein [Nocardioides sp.]